MKRKKYSLADKKDYYTKRINDKKLSGGQRQYADSFLRGVNHIEQDFNTLDSAYWERRQESAKILIKQKSELRADYLRLEKSGDKSYVQNRIENDRKIAFHTGQLAALNDNLAKSNKKPLL